MMVTMLCDGWISQNVYQLLGSIKVQQKTRMFPPRPGKDILNLYITLGDNCLGLVSDFLDPGRVSSIDSTLGKEVKHRNGGAAASFGEMKGKVLTLATCLSKQRIL